MADTSNETDHRPLITKDVTDRWELVQEKDYPLVMVEFTRQVRDYTKQTNATVNSIKGWVTFFGILLIIQIIVLIFF